MIQPSKEPTQWVVKNAVPIGWMKQFAYLVRMFEKIKYIPGEIVECGLGEGNTFAMLAYLTGQRNAKEQKLWGFDSFKGWPQPSIYDASPRNPQKGEWRVSPKRVEKRLRDSGIQNEFPNLKIEIVKGFLCNSLPNFPGRKLALVHLDVDLYEGYRDGLEYLFPMVSEGGIVLFDEYKEFPRSKEYNFGKIEKWPGCTKAVDDYFKNLPFKIRYYPETIKYYVIKSKE